MSAPAELDPALRPALRALVDVLAVGEDYLLSVRRTSGLTLTQVRVLKALMAQSLSAGDLARAAGVPGSSLTRLLERLEGAGLVARTPDPEDRRRVRLELTADGRYAVGNLESLAQGPLGRAVQAMSDGERAAFVAATRRFVTLARQIEEQAAVPAAADRHGGI
jgi:DNA-binding MarR family transcriptional regulator